MKSTNLDIQIIKFIYSWVIVVYHLSSSISIDFKGGYCGVEYFLLTAGVFLFLSFERTEQTGKQRTPGQYLVKRFCRFFPWSITAFVLCVIVDRVLLGFDSNIVTWIDEFASDIWEILLVKWNGMNNNAILVNGPAWTLSAMLIIGFFIWTLLYYYKKPFITLIMPLTLVVGFGYWMHLPSANTEAWIGFTTFGTFRTWLIMCLSYYCIPIARKLEKTRFNKRGKFLLTATEIFVHIFAIVVMALRAERYYQWLLTLLFMVSIAIAMSGHSYLAKALDGSKMAKFLGELSMSIYLVHAPVIRWFRGNFDMGTWNYAKCLPLLGAVLVVSIGHYYVTLWLTKTTPKFWRRCVDCITEHDIGRKVLK